MDVGVHIYSDLRELFCHNLLLNYTVTIEYFGLERLSFEDEVDKVESEVESNLKNCHRTYRNQTIETTADC